MTLTGNAKHRTVTIDKDQIPSRGSTLNVKGWAISEIGYGVLLAKFGKNGAEKYCQWLATRADK